MSNTPVFGTTDVTLRIVQGNMCVIECYQRSLRWPSKINATITIRLVKEIYLVKSYKHTQLIGCES
jgi:hypothetical protein